MFSCKCCLPLTSRASPAQEGPNPRATSWGRPDPSSGSGLSQKGSWTSSVLSSENSPLLVQEASSVFKERNQGTPVPFLKAPLGHLIHLQPRARLEEPQSDSPERPSGLAHLRLPALIAPGQCGNASERLGTLCLSGNFAFAFRPPCGNRRRLRGTAGGPD